MDKRLKNEDWLLRAVSRIAAKRFADRRAGTSDWSRLVVCVWDTYDAARKARSADAAVIGSSCKVNCLEAASRLGLSETAAVFATPAPAFAKTFHSRFNLVCDELRSLGEADPK